MLQSARQKAADSEFSFVSLLSRLALAEEYLPLGLKVNRFYRLRAKGVPTVGE